MAELQYYTGNAGLGLGSSSEIPAIAADNNLTQINNTARDIMLLDNQANIQMFQQKINDRDNLTRQIADDQVQTGNILPEYMPHFMAARADVQKAFDAWRGNFNDIPGYNKYKAAVTTLKDVATHSQSNTAEIGKLRTQVASEGLPRRKQDMQKWLDQQTNQDFWNPIQPYQQLHDFSMGDILKTPPDKTRTVQDPKDPAKSYAQTYADFDDILRFKKDQFLDDQDAADSITQFSKKYRGYNQDQMRKDLESIDAQIDKYNQQRGLSVGQAGFVPHVQRKEIQGQIVITEPDVDFSAKYALAHKDEYQKSTLIFNKDLAKNSIDQAKLGIEAKKLGIEGAKAGAYIRHMSTLDKKIKTEQENKQIPTTDVSRQYTDFINNLNTTGITITSPEGAKSKMGAIFIDELPPSYQNITGPVANEKGKVTVGNLTPYISTDASHRPYYIPKYVDSKTGEQITSESNFAKKTYIDWRRKGFKGDVNDMFKILLKNGAMELIMKGKNGAANYSTLFQSAKTLNALGTTKGEENIENTPPSIPQSQPSNEEE